MEMMRVLRPGQTGTRQLLDKYGDKLICVRYRYNYQTCKRYKTIELMISEDDWQPPPPHPDEDRPPRLTERISVREVAVRIDYHEKAFQKSLREIGERWDKMHKCWYAKEHLVHQIGLADRIIRNN